MKLHNASADIFIPDNTPLEEAFARVTHLGIGAHQDDLEFMALHGIGECFDHTGGKWFGGITCTDGAGSSRVGPYAGYSDAEMMNVRVKEQRAAAVAGHYSVMIQLGYPSAATKELADPSLINDLRSILDAARPEVVYTHNLADKHQTHIGVTVAALEAMRSLPPEARPRRVIGCEVWRGLDWMDDAKKVVMDVSAHAVLGATLAEVFDSQIAGGKRYDLATAGRRAANATFYNPHATDKSSDVIYGMDLTPLVADPSLDIAGYACALTAELTADVSDKVGRALGI